MGIDTLDYIANKYKVDLSLPSPILLPVGKNKDTPRLFAELGFTKGAEIGVYEGKYTERLFRYIPNLYLLAVDIWLEYPGFSDFGAEKLHNAEMIARERLAKLNCNIFKMASTEAAKLVPDASLDFVFIDCNHAYEYVVADIAAWAPKVRPGGILYGHDFDDYSKRSRWREMNVINAVEGWMKSYKIQPWFVLNNNPQKCWMYVKE